MKLFNNENVDDIHWYEMPSYRHSMDIPFKTIKFKFDNAEDFKLFKDITKLECTNKTKSLFWPEKPKNSYKTIRYKTNNSELSNPKYPIYIVSKSRFETRLTSDTLVRMGVKHYIVVEDHQFYDYESRVDKNFVTILKLDSNYLKNYDTCDDLGDSKSKGPGAARNFAWDHSISLGYTRHWVMDDNIQNFYRFDNSKRVIVSDGTILRVMEDHTDRYENVHMSGPNYRFFNVPNALKKHYTLNTRIYSCNLIKNDISFRWRGRYNEDTDLSLMILKSGNCTIQYNAFLQGKIATQSMKGGNTEAFYAEEGTSPKSQMLYDLHPDVTKLVNMYDRDHHYINYKRYLCNKLILNSNIILENKVDDYGMELIYE